MNKLRLVILLGFVSSLSACAHIDAVANDIKSCILPQDKQILKDTEGALVTFAEDALMCDPTLSPAELPVCAEQGLAGACAALGPDADRFETCVVNTIENDPAAAELPKTRAHHLKVKLAAKKVGRS